MVVKLLAFMGAALAWRALTMRWCRRERFLPERGGKSPSS